MISGATIVYLSATDWGAPWHGPQELAVRFAQAGNRVVYVETTGWRRPRLSDASRVAGRLARATRRGAGAPAVEPPAGVEIVSPIVVPGARSRPARALNQAALSRLLRSRVDADTAPPILWIYTPTSATVDLAKRFPRSVLLYHCTQSYPHRPHAPANIADLQRRLTDLADAVVVDGIRLYEELAPLHAHVYRIPSGVNPDVHLDAAPPPWLARARRPVVGFLGTVGDAVDPGLLAAVARARPDWTVAVVGPVVDTDVSELAGLGNIVPTARSRLPTSRACSQASRSA
jgi:hypothetical protein